MELIACVLCDAANTREGLISLLSAGVTRIEPLPMANPGITLAVVASVPPEESGLEFPLRVELVDPTGTTTFAIEGSASIEVPGSDGPLPHLLPLVFVLGTQAFVDPGHYRVNVTLGGERRTLPIESGPRVEGLRSTIRIAVREATVPQEQPAP